MDKSDGCITLGYEHLVSLIELIRYFGHRKKIRELHVSRVSHFKRQQITKLPYNLC